MENTLHRIKKYIDFKGINISSFEKSVDFSNGSFASQLKKNKTIGVDKLENIIKKYPDLDVYWLLTGKGEMIFIKNRSSNPDLNSNTTVVKDLLEKLDDKDKVIESQKKTIESQQETIEAKNELIVAVKTKLISQNDMTYLKSMEKLQEEFLKPEPKK